MVLGCGGDYEWIVLNTGDVIAIEYYPWLILHDSVQEWPRSSMIRPVCEDA